MTMVGTSGPYTILVKTDEDPQNPREWDTFGTMACFHNRYNLGDRHAFSDSDDLLKHLYIKARGGGERGEDEYESLFERFDTPEYSGDNGYKYARAIDAAIMKEVREHNVIMPLYLLDHSGLSISMRDFRDQWDSGQVGWVYASKEKILHEFGGTELTESTLAKTVKLLRAETEIYDHYLKGDCVGFELYHKNEEVDSCWGFLGDNKDQIESIKEHLPDGCADIFDNLTEYTPRQSVIDMLRQARAQSRAAKDEMVKAATIQKAQPSL